MPFNIFLTILLAEPKPFFIMCGIESAELIRDNFFDEFSTESITEIAALLGIKPNDLHNYIEEYNDFIVVKSKENDRFDLQEGDFLVKIVEEDLSESFTIMSESELTSLY